jgi:hypothetical protein
MQIESFYTLRTNGSGGDSPAGGYKPRRGV